LKKRVFLCLLIFTGALFISPATLANAKLDDGLSQAMSLEGDREAGNNVYKLCITCHGANAWGVKGIPFTFENPPFRVRRFW